MKKIISSLSRASSFSFSSQTVQSRWDRVVAESTTLPSLSGEQATSLLYIALNSVSERISKSDPSRSQKAQRLLSRLEQRQHDLNEVLKAVKENEIELVGIIGWGKNTIQPGILKRGEGVSDYHAVVFRKNGKLFIEELGSSKVLFEQPTVDQRLKTDESPCLYVLDNTEENSPVPYSTKGRVYDVQGTTYDSGAYTTTSDKGTRYVVEAPLGNVLVIRFKDHITSQTKFEGVLDGAVIAGDYMYPSLDISKCTQLRFGYVLNSSVHDANYNYSPVSNVVLIFKLFFDSGNLGNLISGGEIWQQFCPDYIARISNVMCNGSCTPDLNYAVENKHSADDFFQSLYFRDEYTVHNDKMTAVPDCLKNGRVFSSGIREDLLKTEIHEASGEDTKKLIEILSGRSLESLSD